MSQEDLASAVGKDQRAISEYESGKRRIAAVDLTAFARVLQIPLIYLLEGTLGDHPLDAVLLQEFHRLPSDDARQAAIQVIRILADTLKRHTEP